MQKRIISLFLCLIMVGSLLTGCVSDKQIDDWAQQLHDKLYPEDYEEKIVLQEVSEEARQMAQIIVDEIIVPGMSEFEKAITIHDWLTFNLDYDHSYTNYHVEEALKTRTCVCQGYAECFELMAEMAGLDASMVGGNAVNSSGKRESHAWNQVKIDGEWYNVDVTWDDPSDGADKKAEDHSGNSYKYFLVSKTQLEENHNATDYFEDEKACNATYDRNVIYQYAASSGLYGDTVYVKSVEEANSTIEKAMKSGKTDLSVWLLNLAEEDEAISDYVASFIRKLNYCISPSDSFEVSQDGLIRFDISFYTESEWEAFPVVKNVKEFKALLDKMGKKGTDSYVVRYEVEEGEPEIAASKYGCKVSYGKYNDGKSWLITVTVQK